MDLYKLMMNQLVPKTELDCKKIAENSIVRLCDTFTQNAVSDA